MLPGRSDSGEKDPETYAAIVSEFPTRVDAVYRCNVSGQAQAAQRYTDLCTSPDAAAKLVVFEDPGELPQRLGAGR